MKSASQFIQAKGKRPFTASDIEEIQRDALEHCDEIVKKWLLEYPFDEGDIARKIRAEIRQEIREL